MRKEIRRIAALPALVLLPAILASCGGGNGPDDSGIVLYDVDRDGVPKFVRTDYIELSKIQKITRFRSAFGHDYWDDFEHCRSMKHYFCPPGGDPGVAHTPSWTEIVIRSPVAGTVARVETEFAGTQVRIQSAVQPAFYFILFHVGLASPLAAGDSVAEGQVLGHHGGDETMSDIAVGVTTPGGWRLVSYFQTMTDSLFQSYQARGIATRDTMIISKAARDADPLTCNGDAFTTTGSIPDWVVLTN